MINYIKIELSLHNLNEKSTKDVCQKIRKMLEYEFHTSYYSDIEIELIESAGVEE